MFLKEFDMIGILSEYIQLFYHSTSKSLFLRLLSLDPPRRRANPEDAALWLWRAHNRLNLILYDHEVERMTATAAANRRRPRARQNRTEGIEISRHLCKKRLFPSKSVCDVCYNRKVLTPFFELVSVNKGDLSFLSAAGASSNRGGESSAICTPSTPRTKCCERYVRACGNLDKYYRR